MKHLFALLLCACVLSAPPPCFAQTVSSTHVNGAPGVPFSVLNYGAKCDGSTNDAVAINAAATAANAAGGGTVQFPAGTCVTGASIIVYSNVVYSGLAPDTSILKAANSLNAAVFLGLNFASLTGTNSTAGIGQFTIRDLTVDGNRANQTAGDCVQVYGYHYTIINFRYQNCYNDGIYTEWSNSGSNPPASSQGMEATLAHIRGSAYGGNGINFQGPHDTIITDLTSFSYVAGANAGMYFGGANGSQFNGMQMFGVHLWGAHKYSLYLENGTGVMCSACQFEGGSVAQIMDGILNLLMTAPHIFACGPTNITGSISGTTLTVSVGPSVGVIGVGQQITGPGVTAGTVITAGSGLSWTVNNSQSVPSETLALNSAGIELGDPTHSTNGMVISAGVMDTNCWLDFRYDHSGQLLDMQVNQFGYPAGLAAYVGTVNQLDIIKLDNVGNGGSPTVSACGTSPSAVIGNDFFGKVVIGTGTVTSCTVTFNYPWPTGRPLICSVQPHTTGAPPATVNGSPSSTGFSFQTASSMGGDFYGWTCQ